MFRSEVSNHSINICHQHLTLGVQLGNSVSMGEEKINENKGIKLQDYLISKLWVLPMGDSLLGFKSFPHSVCGSTPMVSPSTAKFTQPERDHWCICFRGVQGISNSFGVFQTYYEENLGDSVPKASLIGSVQSFLIFFGPLLAGPLYDAGYYRYLLVIGSVAVVIGTFMQSLSNQFWQLILSQSICIGFGGGIIAFIGPSILSTYFTDKLSLASGIGQTGSSIAGYVCFQVPLPLLEIY